MKKARIDVSPVSARAVSEDAMMQASVKEAHVVIVPCSIHAVLVTRLSMSVGRGCGPGDNDAPGCF